MNVNWPLVKLGYHCSKVASGATPKGGNSVYIENGEVYLIRSQNIYNDGFKSNGIVYITEDAAEKLKNVIVEESDILLNITGDSVARVCLAPKEYLPARVNQHVVIIRPNINDFNARFLKYYLASPKMQELLLVMASAGATRNALTKGMIEALEIPKPPLEIQNFISERLEAIEDKIMLNNQINETLDSMSRALFKSWFIDFEPTKAKMKALEIGKDPTSAAMQVISGKTEAELFSLERQDIRNFEQLANTANLFPNEMEVSEIGPIPKGWGITKLEDVLELAYGKSLKSTERKEGQIPVYGSGGLTGWHDQALVEGPGIIIGRKGTIGSIYYETNDFYPIDTVYYVVPKLDTPLTYCYHLLSTLKLEDMNTDAAVPGLNRNNVYRLLVPKVPLPIILKFSKIIKEWIDLKSVLKVNSKQLMSIRNTLLPKLLSGELNMNMLNNIQ